MRTHVAHDSNGKCYSIQCERIDTGALVFGNDWQPEKEVIDRAIQRAESAPIGEVIDFEECFYGDKEN